MTGQGDLEARAASVLIWMERNVDSMIEAIRKDGNTLRGPTLAPYLDEWLKQRTPGKTSSMALRLYRKKVREAGLGYLYGEKDNASCDTALDD